MGKVIKSLVCALAIICAVAVTACEPVKTDKADKAPVISCDPPKGFVKAGRAAHAAHGQFYGCMKSKKVCSITYKVATGNQRKVIFLKREGFFTIPKSSKGWNTSNCGTIYKNDLKKK